jgi:4-diphosphocytidyl-2-C-methyl-D-erythritol kinase
MIAFPNAKINLGLHVVRKRPDGYHDLQTVFFPVPPEDALEVVVRTGDDGGEACRLHLSGQPMSGEAADNLVVKAYRLLAADYALPPVDTYLYKEIPTGAGLGGGSSDATAMLKLLNDLCGLRLTAEQLEAYAGRLGADCPFFVGNEPAYAEGTGDKLTPIALSLRGLQLVVVHPGVSVSTAEAFTHITPRMPEAKLTEIIARPVGEWRERLTNDFEASVFPRYPVIGELKDELYRRGALYASMSGSGSSVYGLFPALEPVDTTFDTPHIGVWKKRIRQ